MKYRAITMGEIKEVGKEQGRPLQCISDSMDVINHWAHEVSKIHNINVKIFETYERVLTIVQKPYKKDEKNPEDTCYCGQRAYCHLHPKAGWQKGRKA